MKTRNPEYKNAFGVYDVTTEGDCEGKSVRTLGRHEGYIDDIAFKLANQCYYSLTFHRVPVEKQTKNLTKTGTKVNVVLDIDSGTWDMKGPERIAYFREMLRGRNTEVMEGGYYASVTLLDGVGPEARALAQKEVVRQSALAKLTKEDRVALGLEG
jgi:hypothetical protein